MLRKNEIIAKEVVERKELWSAVRRAEPIQQVRRIMRGKKILNKDLAERLGVTEASISRMLRGQQNLQIDTLYQLADALEESLTITVGKSSESSSDSSCILDLDDDATATVYEEESTNVVDIDAYRSIKNSPKLTTTAKAVSAGCSVSF